MRAMRVQQISCSRLSQTKVCVGGPFDHYPHRSLNGVRAESGWAPMFIELSPFLRSTSCHIFTHGVRLRAEMMSCATRRADLTDLPKLLCP